MVATGGSGGADARIMVLRAVDRAAGTLQFYTDSRAGKIAVIGDDSRVAMLGWDPARQLQVRLRGVACLAMADATAAAWATVPAHAHAAYRTSAAPGSVSSSPDLAAAFEASCAVIENFAVIIVTTLEVELLDLATHPHRRAVFAAADGWAGTWQTP